MGPPNRTPSRRWGPIAVPINVLQHWYVCLRTVSKKASTVSTKQAPIASSKLSAPKSESQSQRVSLATEIPTFKSQCSLFIIKSASSGASGGSLHGCASFKVGSGQTQKWSKIAPHSVLPPEALYELSDPTEIPPLSRDRCCNTPVALCFLWDRRLSLLQPHFFP